MFALIWNLLVFESIFTIVNTMWVSLKHLNWAALTADQVKESKGSMNLDYIASLECHQKSLQLYSEIFCWIIWLGTTISVRNAKKRNTITLKQTSSRNSKVQILNHSTWKTLSHQSEVPVWSRLVGADSTSGLGRRKILLLVPFHFLPVTMSFSHLLISADSRSLNLKERVK